MQGNFITFEGIDGGGKSTQLRLAAQALRQAGYEVVETREPGGTLLGEELRQLVLDPQRPLSYVSQVLLYLTARSEHVDKVIKPAAASGRIVLCDRYSDSTLVYQGYALGKSEEEIEELRRLNAFAADGAEPGLTLLFDGSPQDFFSRRQQRGVTDRYEQQGLDFQQRLRQGFLTLADTYPHRIKVIDASAPIEQVTAAVQQAIWAYVREA